MLPRPYDLVTHPTHSMDKLLSCNLQEMSSHGQERAKKIIDVNFVNFRDRHSLPRQTRTAHGATKSQSTSDIKNSQTTMCQITALLGLEIASIGEELTVVCKQ